MGNNYISPLSPNYDELILQQNEERYKLELKEKEIQADKELQLELKEKEIQADKELQQYRSQQTRENIFFIGGLILIAIMLVFLIKKISNKVRSKDKAKEKDNIYIAKEKLDLLKSLFEEGILTEEEFNKKKKQIKL